MKQTAKTWKISDLDGNNKRTVTLAQYRAELDAAKAKALVLASMTPYGSNVAPRPVHTRGTK